MRSASHAAVRVKLRAMIRCAEQGAEELAPALRDVLAYVETTT